MVLKFLKSPLPELRRVFKTEESRFYIVVGLQVTGISFFITCFVYYILSLVMRLNHGFFKAHGFSKIPGNDFFYDYLQAEAIDNLPILFAFHIFLFFIGVYVGWLILRPFRVMGQYCEEVLEKPNTPFKVEEFSSFRLLTGFSEFFFEYLRESRRKGELSPQGVPPQYGRIHKPQLDFIFLLHFGLLLLIIAISSCVFIVENSTSIYHSMVELAGKTLQDPNVVNKYFSSQGFVLNELVIFTALLIGLCYGLLGLHLYSKVSGAAFGIFSTMRSFMKGAHLSRVHLVGYTHIREHTRKLNKYLDYVESNLNKSKGKG